MTTKTFLLPTLIFTLAFGSCNRLSPAGFWKNYEHSLLVDNITDQGPHGGFRAMYWKGEKPNAFSSKDILAFASKNGWVLTDSFESGEFKTATWKYNNKPIFPLTSKGFSDTAIHDPILEHFPRWFDGPVLIYQFKTNWETLEPGTDNSTYKNGFAILSKAKDKLSVYHLWGE